jgi:ketosteroid isomerase-like protein
MTTDYSDPSEMADKFFAALQAGDMASCEALFTDDAVVWSNWDQAEKPPSVALAAVAGLAQLQVHYEIIGRDVLDDICVQRHVAHVPLPGGQVASIPAINRMVCRDGRIARIDEYMDSAQMASVVAALQDGM